MSEDRFWRVIEFAREGWDSRYLAVACDGKGLVAGPLGDATPHANLRQAINDGIESGLTEWQPPVRP